MYTVLLCNTIYNYLPKLKHISPTFICLGPISRNQTATEIGRPKSVRSWGRELIWPEVYILLVGGFNPSEKYARQNGNLPQGSGWFFFLKPPSSKNRGTQIIHFNRIFHEINHPFWGKPPSSNYFQPPPRLLCVTIHWRWLEDEVPRGKIVPSSRVRKC